MYTRIYLGLDGGATKTSLTALNLSREVVAEETGKPANFQVIGAEQASANLLEVTESVLKKLNADLSEVKAIYLALAGAGRKNDAEKMLDAFVKLLIAKDYPVPKVRVDSDALAALEGAFGGKPGMVLISGTGSILFAKNYEGKVQSVGGWGRVIGDEGSGYALGRQCLTAVAKEFDGRGKKTAMTWLLKDMKRIGNPKSLISAIYQYDLDIASVAPVVLEAAERGDEVALDIISSSAGELVKYVSAMLRELNEVLPLALSGGLLSTDNFFSRKFRETMSEEFPDIEIRDPEYSPSMGAGLLAYELGEIWD